MGMLQVSKQINKNIKNLAQEVSLNIKNNDKIRKHFNILVVEDDPLNRKEIAFILTSLKQYSIQFAANGIDAVELFLDNGFDLVLLDLGLPDISGLEVARNIRFFAEDTSTPIIAFSGYDFHTEEYLAVGINDFFSKPAQLNLIQQMLDKWLINSTR